MGHVGFIWVLRAVVLLSAPAAFAVSCLHPGLARDAIGAAAVAADASALTAMRKAGPIHSCPGRHTGRVALRAAVEDNTQTLRSYQEWFAALGINPSARPRKRDLTLIKGHGGGDSNPGRRVSLNP